MSKEAQIAKHNAKLMRRAVAEKHRVEMAGAHKADTAQWQSKNIGDLSLLDGDMSDPTYTSPRWQRQVMLGGFLRSNLRKDHEKPVPTSLFKSLLRAVQDASPDPPIGAVVCATQQSGAVWIGKQVRMTKRARNKIVAKIREELNPGMF